MSTDAVPEWMNTLTERLAIDDEFREMFEKTPGKAANVIGVPYDEFQKMMAAVREPGEAQLSDRASAGTSMTLYGRIAGALRDAIGDPTGNCSCDYTAGRWADYCVTN